MSSVVFDEPSTHSPSTRSPSTRSPSTRSPSTRSPSTRSPSTRSPCGRRPSPPLARVRIASSVAAALTHRSLERIWVSRALAANPSGDPTRWRSWRPCTDPDGVLGTSTAATVGGSVLPGADSYSRTVWTACREPGAATRSGHGLARGPIAPRRAGSRCVRPSSACVALS
ncbi:DRHN1 [Human betaherpesvirus 6B]|uniref:DRHN1 protein n=1 Tax=Human herpesvirus 6B TaxID=32604 RepID=Q9WT66_HHV6H|nr:DRHN1 [Human betaherpesvirus 6B]